MLKGSNRLTGAILVVIISFSIIFIQFNEVFRTPGQISFAQGGDGIKSSFVMLYHIKYDKEYWRTQAMNYPYGESVFFTDNQAFISGFFKFLKDHGLDISDHALGIVNLWMLLSFVFCALFIFLILKELQLPAWISVLGALIITFLSPQWDRFGGHYTLTYAWAFPISIYLIIKFYKRPSFLISIITSVYMFILCGKHLYFLVLSGILIVFVFVYIFIKENERFGGRWRLDLHFAIQLLIPFLLFSFFTSLFDHNMDRTAYPWGFIQSTTTLGGIFLPVGKPYAEFIHFSVKLKTVAFVGLTASIVFLAVHLSSVYRGIRFGYVSLFRLTDNPTLNLLYWASFVSFLISLGLPFSLGLENWLNYTGPFRQFRAIGRFIFPFYYMLGIFTIYVLWKWQHRKTNYQVKIIFAIAILFYGYDAWLNLEQNTGKHINRLEALNDRTNQLERNQWVHHHDWEDFQAIMPIPYFHVGSENYWLNGGSPNQSDAYIASLKTGLPLNSVMLSRTSISESLKNIELVLEPLERYTVLEDLPSDKPFLLMVYKKGKITECEQRIVNFAEYLEENKYFTLYKFYPDILPEVRQKYLSSLYAKAKQIENDSVQVSDFIFEDYSTFDGGQYTGPVRNPNVFYELSMPDTGWFTFSFWMEDIDTDLWPRTRIYTNYCFSNGKCINVNYNFAERMVAIEDSRGLYEDSFHISNKGQLIRFSYKNRVAVKGSVQIDNLLIRKQGEDILHSDGQWVFLNDRPVRQAGIMGNGHSKTSY